MKTKLISLVLALALLASLFTGCSPKAKPVTDTVKWFNTTYALLTTANQADVNLIGGYEKNAINQKLVQELLDEWWDVTDRATADETLEWILSEGHRKDFADEMVELKDSGILDLTREDLDAALADYDENDRAYILDMVDAYNANPEHPIDAWDYSRAMQLLGYYYIADYYTEQETLDKSLEVAKTLQGLYPSWDDMVQSYLDGYQYWNGDNPDDEESGSAQRRKIYEDLKASENNPYTLDWNLELTKTW